MKQLQVTCPFGICSHYPRQLHVSDSDEIRARLHGPAPPATIDKRTGDKTMRYWGAVLATALVASPLVTVAQPISGLYVGGGVGADIPQDTRVTPGAPSIGGAGHLRLNQDEVGLAGIGAVGYGLGNGVRFELQGDFLRNGIDQLGRMPFPASNKGTARTYGLMANALYNMNVGVPWLYPYIGVGGGYQWTHLDGFNAVQAGGPFSVSSDDTRGKPAAQVIVGASMPISGVPGLSLTADYRFMKIWGGEKFNTTEIPVGGGRLRLTPLSSWGTSTTISSCSACATPSMPRQRRRPRSPRLSLRRRLLRHAPTWCSSIGTRQR